MSDSHKRHQILRSVKSLYGAVWNALGTIGPDWAEN